MTYSSAVYASPEQSAGRRPAQQVPAHAEGAGLLVGAGAGKHVLEIGSGWGGFCAVRRRRAGLPGHLDTISKGQHDLATERVRAAGLEHLVDIQLRDYREISGTYDAIVSIEMLEAVGAEYFETFLRGCDRALVPAGR